jgi:hypothetical protein
MKVYRSKLVVWAILSISFLIIACVLTGSDGYERPGVQFGMNIRHRNPPPDWTGYQKLGAKLAGLLEARSVVRVVDGSSSLHSQSGDPVEAGIQQQISKIQQIFEDEQTIRTADMAGKIESFREKAFAEVDHNIHEYSEIRQAAYIRDITAKTKEMENDLQMIRSGLESGDQVILTSLQIRLSLTDLIFDPKEQQKSKQEIEQEIISVRRKIERRYRDAKQKNDASIAEYKQYRQSQFEDDLRQYKAAQMMTAENNTAAYRVKLEKEYNLWRAQREQEVRQAIQMRQTMNLN